MFVAHIALGGCLKAPPVSYGLTADTGGHIAYVLGAAEAQARRADVDKVVVFTRAFSDPDLGPEYAVPRGRINARLSIRRLDDGVAAYLSKDDLADRLEAYAAVFVAHLERLATRPDVIHAHFADAAFVALAAQRRFGVPVVYTPHSLALDKRRTGVAASSLTRRVARERAAIAGADAVVVSTRDEAARQVSAYGVAGAGGRTRVIPPGVPPRSAPAGGTTLADRLDAWLDRPDLPILLAVSRPVAKKNLIGLIRAYAGSPELRAKSNLVILAGQHGGRLDPEEAAVLNELGALAATPALSGRVALPPAHDEGDVAALYARAARGGVFVNPALHEPFGLTLIEAAAAGAPVVATRNGGPAEIVERLAHGRLVDPTDDAAIADACLEIVGDPELQRRLGETGRTASARYDWDAYAADSVALYRGLVSARRRAPAPLRAVDRTPARPRLLACDIDQTLTGCTAGAQAFTGWRRTSDLPFIVATGRDFDAANRVLEMWRLPCPDAFIVDVGTRLVLPEGDGWRTCRAFSDHLARDWRRAAVQAALEPLGLEAQPDGAQSDFKLSFFGRADQARAARERLDQAGLPARVVFSHDRMIDVLPAGGGKAAAIAFYAAITGWTLAECIAAGDSGNDEDMLQACGAAIVVGNAGAELDGLTPRPGLMRVANPHALGVMEGLARLGLAESDSDQWVRAA